MGCFDTQFDSGKGGGNGRIHIADHYHKIRCFLYQYFFIGNHHMTGLFGVGADAHPKVNTGEGRLKSLKNTSDMFRS